MTPTFEDMMKSVRDRRISEYSDTILTMYFKAIRYQVKYRDRNDEVLCDYIHELEYRNLKYRM